jgi:hypothetical protein
LDEYTVFDGEVVGRESVFLPFSDLDFVRKDAFKREVFGDRDILKLTFLNPFLIHFNSVFIVEGSEVRNIGCGKKDISCEVIEVIGEFFNIFFPSDSFS